MQKCSLQVTVKELVQCTSKMSKEMVTSPNFVHAISRKLIVQCTSNIEEVTLKWSLHEISFIQSQKGRDKSQLITVFL